MTSAWALRMVTPAAPVARVGVVLGLVLTGRPPSAKGLGQSALPRTSAFFAVADVRGAGAYGHFRPYADIAGIGEQRALPASIPSHAFDRNFDPLWAGALARDDQRAVDCLHHQRNRQVVLHERRHRPHVPADVAEQLLVAGAQVVQARLRCVALQVEA